VCFSPSLFGPAQAPEGEGGKKEHEGLGGEEKEVLVADINLSFFIGRKGKGEGGTSLKGKNCLPFPPTGGEREKRKKALEGGGGRGGGPSFPSITRAGEKKGKKKREERAKNKGRTILLTPLDGVGGRKKLRKEGEARVLDLHGPGEGREKREKGPKGGKKRKDEL